MSSAQRYDVQFIIGITFLLNVSTDQIMPHAIYYRTKGYRPAAEFIPMIQPAIAITFIIAGSINILDLHDVFSLLIDVSLT